MLISSQDLNKSLASAGCKGHISSWLFNLHCRKTSWSMFPKTASSEGLEVDSVVEMFQYLFCYTSYFVSPTYVCISTSETLVGSYSSSTRTPTSDMGPEDVVLQERNWVSGRSIMEISEPPPTFGWQPRNPAKLFLTSLRLGSVEIPMIY